VDEAGTCGTLKGKSLSKTLPEAEAVKEHPEGKAEAPCESVGRSSQGHPVIGSNRSFSLFLAWMVEG